MNWSSSKHVSSSRISLSLSFYTNMQPVVFTLRACSLIFVILFCSTVFLLSCPPFSGHDGSPSQWTVERRPPAPSDPPFHFHRSIRTTIPIMMSWRFVLRLLCGIGIHFLSLLGFRVVYVCLLFDLVHRFDLVWECSFLFEANLEENEFHLFVPLPCLTHSPSNQRCWYRSNLRTKLMCIPYLVLPWSWHTICKWWFDSIKNRSVCISHFLTLSAKQRPAWYFSRQSLP